MKKKRNKEKIIWTLAICMLVLISFAVGYTLGMLSGGEIVLRGMSILFAGADIDIDVDVNETLLVQEMNRTLYPTLNKAYEGCDEK